MEFLILGGIMMKNKQQQYVCEKTGRIVGFERTAFGAEFVVDPEFLEKCECPIHSCKVYAVFSDGSFAYIPKNRREMKFNDK